MLIAFSVVGLVGVTLSLYGLGDMVTNRVNAIYNLASLKVEEVSDRLESVEG